MTEAFVDSRKRRAEKDFVVSWLRQTNEGEFSKSLGDSLRIDSQYYLQYSSKRKKKQSASCDSSIIEEPVRTSLKSNTEKNEKNEKKEKPNNESFYLAKSISKGYDSIPNEDSYLSTPLPETVFKKRMRHKTREDRYEIDKKKNIKYKTSARNSEKSRRKRRKSNKSLHEKPLPSFSSRKIGTDRLTFKASNNRGIFKNGRASSPITRRGIPDLSFSEMEFLQHSKKFSPRESGYSTKKKGRIKAKCKNLENDEISTFFKPSTVSLRVNNNQYHLKSSDRLIREAEGSSENPGLPIIDKKKPFLNRRASIGSSINLPTQSSSLQSYGSIKNCSSCIAKNCSLFSETQNSSHNHASKLIRDTHNDNHLMDTCTGSRLITSTYIKSNNKDEEKKQLSFRPIENSEWMNEINASLDEQNTYSNMRMTNTGHHYSDVNNNLNVHKNLKGEKEDKIIENNMKHVGTMTICNLDQQLNTEKKRKHALSQEKKELIKTRESTEVSNFLKSPTNSLHIKRPSTTVPILRASMEKKFTVEEIQNHHKQTNTEIGSLLFHKVHTKEKTKSNLSYPQAVNFCTSKIEQDDNISINYDNHKSLFDEISICELPKNQVEGNISSKKTSADRYYSKASPRSSINFQSGFSDDIYYNSITSPNSIAEAVSSLPVQLVKELNQEEKYQFISQLQHGQNSNEHIPNHTINQSPINMSYTYPSLMAEDTQSIGTKHVFYDTYNQHDDQSGFINQNFYHNNDFAHLDELHSSKIKYEKDEDETILGFCQLDNCEFYKNPPTITNRKTSCMTSKPQDFKYQSDTNRFIEEKNDMEGFWYIHRGY